MSKKTAVIATRKKLVTYHQNHLTKISLKAKAPRVARDLGLDYTGSNKRATGTIRKRICNARIRADRVGQLNKVNKRAKALYNTGVWPTATYGVEGIGYTPTTVGQIRIMGVKSVASTKQGRCPITAIA
eukprot:9307080-Karenia_brevis.AAC.1